MKHAQEYIGKIVSSFLSKHPIGLCLEHWGDIVGRNLSTFVMPQKIVFAPGAFKQGELHLIAPNAVYAAEARLESHTIKRRVNSFFKKNLIDTVRIKHIRPDKAARIFGTHTHIVDASYITQLKWNAPLNNQIAPQKVRQSKPFTDHQNACLNTIEDLELKAALLSLGKHII